jgi:sulfite exporter TauE/SafE
VDLLPALDPGQLQSGAGAALAASAVVLGVSGSLHCFLMCGPLACAAGPVVIGRKRANSAPAAYHAARIAAYSLMGGLLGTFGSGFSQAFAVPLRSVLPWMLVAALCASALDLGKRMAPVPGFANLSRLAARVSASLSAPGRAALLGAITPLLPCGLLYGVFAAAFTTASFGGGALLLGSFALGGAPALALAQLPLGLGARLRGWPALALQKGLPLVAAAVIAYRALLAQAGQACH